MRCYRRTSSPDHGYGSLEAATGPLIGVHPGDESFVLATDREAKPSGGRLEPEPAARVDDAEPVDHVRDLERLAHDAIGRAHR